jgi:hypothetical protein
VVERGGLENRCASLAHRGFESLPLRLWSRKPHGCGLSRVGTVGSAGRAVRINAHPSAPTPGPIVTRVSLASHGHVGAAVRQERSEPSHAGRRCPAQAAAWPRCLAAEARVDCSHVSRAPTRTHPVRVGRGASDPLGLRSSRRGSGCGGVRRVPRVHCGLHRRVAPQGRRRSSRRRPVGPRGLVRGLVLDRRDRLATASGRWDSAGRSEVSIAFGRGAAVPSTRVRGSRWSSAP